MKKIALLFPGQGSQYIGMGKKLYDSFPVAKHTFEEASSLLGFNLAKLCFEGDIEELTKTENAQPAILTTSVSVFKVYTQHLELKPCISAGHSLGEFSALTCAGAIKFSDAVRIVRKRGLLMKEITEDVVGKMAAIAGISSDVVNEYCVQYSSDDEFAVVSNYNSLKQTVISGHSNIVLKITSELEKQGAQINYLNVSAPFHSPIVKFMAKGLENEMRRYKYYRFKWPVISNVDALPYLNPLDIISKMTEQVSSAVQWKGSMEYLEKLGVNLVFELGPKTILKNLSKDNIPSIRAFSSDLEHDINELEHIVGRRIMESTERMLLEFLDKCMAAAISTQNSNDDYNEYQLGVIRPYLKIKKIYDMIKDKKESIDKSEVIQEALALLKTILKTKKVSNKIQHELINCIKI